MPLLKIGKLSIINAAIQMTKLMINLNATTQNRQIINNQRHHSNDQINDKFKCHYSK
jgi:hypothetical protein